jgi:VWFA-related protein
MARFVWLYAFFICLVIPSLAQESASSSETSGKPALTPPLKLIPRSHDEREQRFRDLHRMILNVLVTDASGNPISGLTQQDFTLLDNRQPQRLVSFREMKGDSGTAPAHVVLLVDGVNNTSRSIAYQVKEIGKYLGHQGHLIFPTSVAVLTGSGIEVSRASQVGATLWDESQNMMGNAQSPYDCANDNSVSSVPLAGHGDKNIGLSIEKTNDGNCLNQKFILSLNALSNLATQMKETPGRVIVIWMGPGWPSLSGLEFLPDTSAIKQNLFDHLVELSNSLREAQVTLDALSSPDLFRATESALPAKNSLPEVVETEKQVSASSLSLNALARHSGGRVLENGRDIAGFIAACVADVRTYYVLTFDFAPASGLDEFHSLEVEVNRVGANVRTNKQYYSEP